MRRGAHGHRCCLTWCWIRVNSVHDGSASNCTSWCISFPSKHRRGKSWALVQRVLRLLISHGSGKRGSKREMFTRQHDINQYCLFVVHVARIHIAGEEDLGFSFLQCQGPLLVYGSRRTMQTPSALGISLAYPSAVPLEAGAHM